MPMAIWAFIRIFFSLNKHKFFVAVMKEMEQFQGQTNVLILVQYVLLRDKLELENFFRIGVLTC